MLRHRTIAKRYSFDPLLAKGRMAFFAGPP
jgi:hypothetical protein